MNLRPAILFAFGTALTGCHSPAPVSQVQEATPTDNLSVTNVSLFADDHGKPGAEVKFFDYRQRVLHMKAVLSKPVSQVTARWIFSAKSTAAGNNRDIQSLDAVVNEDILTAQIELKNNWPVGVYHVEILLDNSPLHSFDYQVTGEKSKIVFLGHSLATDDGKGLPAQLVKSFKPKDRTIHLQVTTKGIDTSEPEVVWRLFEIRQGKEVEVANTVQPKIRLQDSVLKAQFTSPRDWDKGQYRADISLGGKKAHSIEFKVE